MSLARTYLDAAAALSPGIDKTIEKTGIDDIFREHAAAVASLGLAMLGTAADAEDLVQDVFLRAWRGIDRLQKTEAIRSWIMTIAVHTARTRLRRRKMSRLIFGGDDPELGQLATPGTLPDDRLLILRLFTVLEELPVELRIAWVLRYVQSETVEEVATLCGWSVSTAKRRIAAAQARVTRELGQ